MGQDRPLNLMGEGASRRWPKTLLKAAISLCVLGIVLSLVDIDVVLSGLRRIGLQSFFLYLSAFLALHSFSALKWRFFLGLSDCRLRRRDALRCHAGALFGNLCLPGLIGGDLFRLVLASRLTGRTEAVLMGSLADRLADLLALLLLVGVGFIVAMATPEFSANLPREAVATCIVLAACLAASIVGAIWFLRRRSIRRYPRTLARRLLGLLRAWRAFATRPAAALSGLLFCLLLQLGFVALNIVLGRAVGLDLDPRLWFLLWPLAKIIAMAPISFGGIGVREAAFAALVAPFAAAELAVAQSLIWQCVLVMGGLLCGLSIPFMNRMGSATND